MEKYRKEIKHIIKRIKEEIKATKEIAHVLTFRKAFMTFIGKIDIQLMVYNGRKEFKWMKKQLLRKHEIMNEFFEKKFNKIRPNIKQNTESKNQKEDTNIWICWWQGIENMPEIVSKCVESIKYNSGGKNVIIITFFPPLLYFIDSTHLLTISGIFSIPCHQQIQILVSSF